LIARAVEYDLTSPVKPPRSFFVNYPLGHTAGKPFDRENQTAILKSALDRA
jgi:hypothetical protein